MSVVVAVLLATGVFITYDVITKMPKAATTRATPAERLGVWLSTAGLVGVTPRVFLCACVGCGVATAALCLVLIGSATVAVLGLVAASWAPVSFVQRRRREVQAARRGAWPEAIDLLAGSVRTGDTLPAALSLLAEQGPDALRPTFRRVVADNRVSGDLAAALVRLGDALADPVTDRVVATLVVAHRVGGRDLVRVLVTLGAFLREDLAVRKEIIARQSWTLVAARVAASAPVLVLLMVASRPQGANAFESVAGAIVVTIGGAMTLVGYRLMVAIGRLPDEPRVLGSSAVVGTHA